MCFQYFFSCFLFTGQTVNAIQNVTPCPLRAPLVVTIVGLPCRGKSLAAHKIARHLCWKGEFAKGKLLLLFCYFFLSGEKPRCHKTLSVLLG